MSITLSFEVRCDIPLVELSSDDWRVVYVDQEGSLTLTEDRFTFSEDFTSLTIDPVVLTDEGTYTLTATNEAGTDSASIVLDVECKSQWPQYIAWKVTHVRSIHQYKLTDKANFHILTHTPTSQHLINTTDKGKNTCMLDLSQLLEHIYLDYQVNGQNIIICNICYILYVRWEESGEKYCVIVCTVCMHGVLYIPTSTVSSSLYLSLSSPSCSLYY